MKYAASEPVWNCICWPEPSIYRTHALLERKGSMWNLKGFRQIHHGVILWI